MMRVPWVLPVKEGPEFFDGARGRLPAIVVVTLGLREGMQRDQLHRMLQLSEFILSERKGLLLQFYRKAIDAHQNGIVPISSRYLNVPGMQARYRNNNGLEIIEVTLYPEFFLKPPKPPEGYPWDYLVISLDWQTDADRWRHTLHAHAKIRLPKEIRDTCVFVRSSMAGSAGDGPPPWDGDVYPQGVPDYDMSWIDYDARDPSNAPGTWVGYNMAESWGTPYDRKRTTKYANTSESLFGVWDGFYHLCMNTTGNSNTAGWRGCFEYFVDLRAFTPGLPIDIEIRGYWDTFHDDGPFAPLKVRYALYRGGVPHWGALEQIETSPAYPNGIGTSGFNVIGTYETWSDGVHWITDDSAYNDAFLVTNGSADQTTWELYYKASNGDGTWTLRGPVRPYQPVDAQYMYTDLHGRFVIAGAAKKDGVLRESKPFDVPLDPNGDYTSAVAPGGTDDYSWPGDYIGNITYNPTVGDGLVTFSDKGPADPLL